MSNSFTLQDYIQPEWAGEMQHRYYFQVIKDGCVLGKIDVKHKSFNLIGRLEDLCDLPIDNQTVSRKHAILQARQNDHYLYLYDLGSAHGTFVNKQRLPPRTFKKLSPFDNVKFGISSRIFILRCPEYEDILDNQQIQKDNKFNTMIQNQHKQLSKGELKEKYLQMLQNDPYFAANQAPRKLMGRQQPIEQDQYEGIDWGISDQREIYSYKNDSDIPIEPDVLRRLNLDSAQLNKLAEYEEHLRKYQEVQGELNQLTARQKRQYGLEQKLQSKKDKLQKRFVEAVETLQKSQDWLRVNIFGEKVQRDKKNITKIRQKQNDTFGDDEYFDRTLQNKDQGKNETLLSGSITTQDYWKLSKELDESLKNLQVLRTKLAEIENSREIGQSKQGEDELDNFMKDNNMNLQNENILILKRQQEIEIAKIQVLKSKFKQIMGQEQLQVMTDRRTKPSQKRTIKQQYKEKSLEESLVEAKKKMQLNQNIQSILNRLEAANQQDQQLNELDPTIFNYYKGRQKQEDDNIDLQQEQFYSRKRNNQDYASKKFQKPISKHLTIESLDVKHVQQDVVDLTKTFK